MMWSSELVECRLWKLTQPADAPKRALIILAQHRIDRTMRQKAEKVYEQLWVMRGREDIRRRVTDHRTRGNSASLSWVTQCLLIVTIGRGSRTWPDVHTKQ